MTTINKQPQRAHDNGYINSAPASTSPSPSPPPSSSTPQQAKPAVHRINPSQFSFTPMRQPPPPSPLSQVAHPPGSNASSSGSGTPDTQPMMKVPKKVHIASPEDDKDAPPCFIHSGLDKHGSLQDWLRGKADHFLPHPHNRKQPFRDHRESASAARRSKHTPTNSTGDEPQLTSALRVGGAGAGGQAQKAHPATDDAGPRPLPAQQPSLRDIRGRRGDGYESDQSTTDSRMGSPPDNGYEYEYDEDDDDESPNLTRQLAATAQGVREVSKELGRTTVHSRIQHILIVTKARDNGLIRLTRELALYLMQRELPVYAHSAASSMTDLSRFSERSERSGSSGRRIVVYVDAQLRNSKRFDAAGLQRDYPHLFEPIPRRRSSSASASTTSLSALASSWGNGSASAIKPREDGQLRYWTADMCSNSPQLFDFVVTLGGDGTVLFTSWLFQKIVPPVLPFALGSLGFLTNFDFKDYRKTMDSVIDEGIRVNLRMRFTCTVYRAIAPDESMIVKSHGKRRAIRRPGGDILVRKVDKDGWDALEGGLTTPKHNSGKEKEILCFSTRPVEQFEVLNDLIVDRGPSPFVSLLEVFGDDHHLTTVQADGLTVSTPTGSTAYSLSAGGSLVHPQIPALLITPICPHTLSFRPMLLPDSMELRVCVPYNSRSTAWASFDGRGRIELKQGDHIKITASKYPFPTVCADKQSTDWFSAISRTLRWNERQRQKSFVVVEEDAEPAKKHKDAHGAGDGTDEDDFHSSDGSYFSEDEFDIDDRSGGETPSPRGAIPVPPRIRTIVDSSKSGVQSPDRFASGYNAPPPLSQRHLLEKLATVESQLRKASLSDLSDFESGARYADPDDDDDDESPSPLADPEPGFLARNESEATLDGKQSGSSPAVAFAEPPAAVAEPAAPADDFESAPATASSSNSRHGRSESIKGSLTPRQGRSRSRSRHRAASRSRSPAVGPSKTKAFAFFGQDDSTSELSDHSF